MDNDVIVIGAGPAGSTAAREISSLGWNVLLLDKSRFPRDKPCGGGVTIRTDELLPFSLDPVIEDVVYGAHLRLRDGRIVTRYTKKPITYMTQRIRLDAFLVEQSQRSGVEFRDGIAVTHVRRLAPDQFEVIDRSGEKYTSRVLIGADGANGIVSKNLGYENPIERAIAIEGNMPFFNGIPEEYKGMVGLNFGLVKGGYGWIFPKGDHLNIGIGGWKINVGNSLRSDLANLCDIYGFDFSKLEQIRGHHLPLIRPGTLVSAGGSAVIGDAAGLVDPLSGEGIYGAIASGVSIAPSVDNFLRGQSTALDDYHFFIADSIIPDIEKSRALMEIFHVLPDPFVWLLQHSDRFWSPAGSLIRGETTYSEIVNHFGKVLGSSLGPISKLAQLVSGRKAQLRSPDCQ
ncbi:MAG: hypothetical protein CL792_03550 [Chloroflexi bacterium]|nr:hypothetical protein [Chloroflexota bacterium]|tara:strand:+ start:6096 stop:7298 length:1203 start_codon:yes stop_codon:yes gene_type:complete